jgi:hypothetical protein
MHSAPDADQVAQGRTYVRIAAAALVLTSVATIALYVARAGTGRLPQQAVRLALTVGLAFALTRGQRWARWVTLVLLFLGLFVIVPVFRDPEAFRGPKLAGTLVVLALWVTYGLIGRGLLYSASVGAFFRARGGRGIGASAPAS